VTVRGAIQDPVKKEQGIKQDHNPRLQESRLWPVQKNLNGYDPREKRGPGELVDFRESLPSGSRLVHSDVQEVGQR